MKNILILSFFSLLIFASCSKQETCPEHERSLICDQDAFEGTWEFVGFDFELRENDCLSSLEIEPSENFGDITITKSDDPQILELGTNSYKIKTTAPCIARQIGSNGILLSDSRIGLENPNHLVVSTKFLFDWNHRIYRRKN